MKISILVLSLFLFGLVACTSKVPSAATQTPHPATISPPTHTSEPASTPTVNPSTPTPDGTATSNPQFEIDETEVPDCLETFYSFREESPDGQWVARMCELLDNVGVSDAYPQFDLHIIKRDGSKKWQVSFRDITGDDFISYTNQHGEHIPFISIPFPHHWYKDSRYLFIIPTILLDGQEGPTFGLYRFDTQTGRISPFLPFGESSYDFAFSPDDEYYVYSYGMDEKYIHIQSLQSGKDQAIRLPSEKGSTTHFLWAPDNTKFVFIYQNDATEKNSLLLFDTIQKAYTTLLENDQLHYDQFHYLVPLKWISNTQLTLASPWDELQFLLNIETKELQPIPTKQAP